MKTLINREERKIGIDIFRFMGKKGDGMAIRRIVCVERKKVAATAKRIKLQIPGERDDRIEF